MNPLSDKELRKVRLAADIAKVLKGVMYLAIFFVLALIVMAIIIQVNSS